MEIESEVRGARQEVLDTARIDMLVILLYAFGYLNLYVCKELLFQSFE
jgi:hypothetical protein